MTLDPATVDGLAEECFKLAALAVPARREPLRVWAMSGVERVHLPDSRSVILKYATGPYVKEAAVLRHVAAAGVPVPRLLSAATRGSVAAMVLEDLGGAFRDPTLDEAAHAAVAVHHVAAPAEAAQLDLGTLVGLPASCLTSVTELADTGRWADVAPERVMLEELAAFAEARSQGAERPPFGLCHGEFNPTSLHIGDAGWRLIDWAGPINGPGLLDLAGWQYTTHAPDFRAFDALVAAYVAAGGPVAAKSPRGGLPPAQWAFGWHRLCIVDWYLQQATIWIADRAMDTRYQVAVRRHLAEAVACFRGR